MALSMVDRVEVSSGLRVVGTAVGDRSDVGAVALCLCFHLACSLSVRPSQNIGVGALYVNFCFAGWSIMVPFSAYQSALSALDRSSQCSGFGGYERSWTGAPGRLRRRTSALFVDGGNGSGDLVSWAGCGLVSQGVVGWFSAAENSGGVSGESCIHSLGPGVWFKVCSSLRFDGYGSVGSGGRHRGGNGGRGGGGGGGSRSTGGSRC